MRRPLVAVLLATVLALATPWTLAAPAGAVPVQVAEDTDDDDGRNANIGGLVVGLTVVVVWGVVLAEVLRRSTARRQASDRARIDAEATSARGDGADGRPAP